MSKINLYMSAIVLTVCMGNIPYSQAVSKETEDALQKVLDIKDKEDTKEKKCKCSEKLKERAASSENEQSSEDLQSDEEIQKASKDMVEAFLNSGYLDLENIFVMR